MTRGRKKDLTIPPSRALTQQRDYRARKAAYIANLEERCMRAETENVKLKKDLELAKAGLPLTRFQNSEVIMASSELRQQLAAATDALTRFQNLAFSEAEPSTSRLRSDSVGLRPASFPSPPPSDTSASPSTHPSTSTSQSSRSNHSPTPRQLPSISNLLSAEPPTHAERPASHVSPTSVLSRSPSLDPSCCGGILDCQGLVESENDDDMDENDELEEEDSSAMNIRISGVRSTTDHRLMR